VGSVNALIVSYYVSAAFKDLKESTKANRRNILERFRTDYGDLPVKGAWSYRAADDADDRRQDYRIGERISPCGGTEPTGPGR